MPTVSIILPTYNREKFLPEAFAAIAGQTFTDWELIVVDDGSTDGTRELVPRLTDKFSQPVRYIYQENQGAYGARNTGLDHASGRYVAFYDSDDLWLPHHLQDCVAALESNPDVDWVYGACRIVDYIAGRELAPHTFYIDDQPRPFLRLNTKRSDPLRIIVDHNAVRCMISDGLLCGLQNSIIRSHVFDNMRFDAASRNEAEDQLIVVRVLKRGCRLAYLNSVHVIYRVHSANSSGACHGASVYRQIKIQLLLVRGYERLARTTLLTFRERIALRRRLSTVYFWHLGYALMWRSGLRKDAARMYLRALQLWPLEWRYWKTAGTFALRCIFTEVSKFVTKASPL
jgi:glycosyltransferase involved in cell wall biosynthesis